MLDLPPADRPYSSLKPLSTDIMNPSNQYFGGEVFRSPECSDSDGDGDSDSTLEDIEVCSGFGYPLQRMFRMGSVGAGDEHSLFGSISSTSLRTNSSALNSSATSSVSYDINYEALIDRILGENPAPGTDSMDMLVPESFSSASRTSIMIKCLPRTSTELYVLLELNHLEHRQDPWNPAPHVLCVVERGDRVFLCMERLSAYDQPPFKTVANYIDFFRQVLEGLTFLHEHYIAQISFRVPAFCMVDLGSAPGGALEHLDNFDRTVYPVRYYFNGLSRAVNIGARSSSALSSAASLFKQDVKDCGMMIDRLLAHVPRIGPKFKSLVKAMTSRGFGADDSRKLFEALCKSLESSIFYAPVAALEPRQRPSSTPLSPMPNPPS